MCVCLSLLVFFLITCGIVRDDPEATKKRTGGGGSEVIFTYLQSCTKDARDISLDYKLSGPLLAGIPRVNCDYNDLFLKECHPDPDTGKGYVLFLYSKHIKLL